jgi:hypothetical protein
MDVPFEVDRQLIINAAFMIVSDVVPEEAPDFDDLIAEHYARIALSTKEMSDSDSPLSFDSTSLLSPEVTGVIAVAISTLIVAVQKELLDETAKAVVAAIKARVQRPAALAKPAAMVTSPMLTPEQVQQLHGKVLTVFSRGILMRSMQ